ncbi:hypothetical protein BDR22DRAFT_488889 [Usnea florida]
MFAKIIKKMVIKTTSDISRDEHDGLFWTTQWAVDNPENVSRRNAAKQDRHSTIQTTFLIEMGKSHRPRSALPSAPQHSDSATLQMSSLSTTTHHIFTISQRSALPSVSQHSDSAVLHTSLSILTQPIITSSPRHAPMSTSTQRRQNTVSSYCTFSLVSAVYPFEANPTG